MLGDFTPLPELARLAGEASPNMTLLALSTSGYVNGVALRHREVSEAMFPGHRIFAITNGVDSYTWTAPSFRKLFDEALPGWAAEPTLLARVDAVPEHEIWQAHLDAKRDLFAFIEEKTGTALDEKALTLGFARRFTPYKRPHLIFSDLDRLRRVTRQSPLQLVFAGKAHPRDEEGKRLIAGVFEAVRALEGSVKIAFLHDHDMTVAKKLVAGVDVWLNTPEPPLEASGTCEMKAAHNDVLNFSILDGWWIEGHIEGVTGWSIGPAPGKVIDREQRLRQKVDDLYGKLEYVLQPLYYTRPDQWGSRMRETIDDIASCFNSHRMLRRYVTDACFRRGDWSLYSVVTEATVARLR